MTERLYYNDSYLSLLKARVVETADDGRTVYLDRTAFYPTSGGQPHDKGTISGQPVIDVIDEGERIAHRLSEPVHLFEPVNLSEYSYSEHVHGDVAECQVDWERRYDHMQQHTGQHILSAVWLELFSLPTVSFHMAAEYSSIELGAKDLTEAQIERAEARANEIAREARSVTVSFDDSQAAVDLRKPSTRSGILRIISIDGLDRSACGGTHVKSTSEVAPIQIRRLEKLRGNTRVEFVCGDRACRRTKVDYRIVSELSRLNGVGIGDLTESFLKLRARLDHADKEGQRMAAALGRMEGVALYEKTPPSPDGVRRAALDVASIDDLVRAKAQIFTSPGPAVMLVVGTVGSGVLIACSSESGFDAGAILRTALAKSGGRGGGNSRLAQGSLPDVAEAGTIRDLLGFE